MRQLTTLSGETHDVDEMTFMRVKLSTAAHLLEHAVRLGVERSYDTALIFHAAADIALKDVKEEV